MANWNKLRKEVAKKAPPENKAKARSRRNSANGGQRPRKGARRL